MYDIIKQIHDTDGHFELAITGGGTSAISQLLAVPGASRSLLNAVVPYSDSALRQYIGTTPDQACNDRTARLLATRAFHNAQNLCSTKVIGIGATAALQTDRKRRGKDQIFVAAQTMQHTQVYHLELNKAQSRTEQELQCSELVIRIMADNLNIPISTVPKPFLAQTGNESWQSLLSGRTLMTGNQEFQAVLPGAFNPPHQGHFDMRRIAERKLGIPVAFELSAFNVDKPPLDFIDLQQRQTWLGEAPVVFTRAATFIEKSALFPGATFVVGTDTLIRIDDAKYYGNSEAGRASAIETFKANGHRFLVFGRMKEDQFVGLANLPISDALKSLCIEVPEEEFRLDISSSEIRANHS
tara:strand:- start:16164 stop:17228 length:1065 start_codon:yes stop_codon:yes gene_type:complete